MKAILTVSNSLIIGIFDGLKLDSKKTVKFLEESGLDAERTLDPSKRTSLIKFNGLWKVIKDSYEEELLGLTIGLQSDPKQFGLAAYSAINSKTLQEMLVSFAYISSIINNLMRCHFAIEGERAIFRMGFLWDLFKLESDAVDLTFAAIRSWISSSVEGVVEIKEVNLRRLKPANPDRYPEIFGVEPQFAAKENALVFAAKDLKNGVRNYDNNLRQILSVYVEAEVKRIPVPDDLLQTVRALVEYNLEAGTAFDIESISKKIYVSTRTLQRELSRYQTNFREIVNLAKQQISTRLLMDPSVSLDRVSELLGYSEVTAFIRSFKRWYGVSPGEYRKRML
jgi:AraC-like DNA-binding protein